MKTDKFISVISMVSIPLTLLLLIAGCATTNQSKQLKEEVETDKIEYIVKIETEATAENELIESENKDEDIKPSVEYISETTNTNEEYVTTSETRTEESSSSEESINGKCFSEKDVTSLAKVLYNECRGISSDAEKACVAWIACNRVDAGYADTIYDVLTAPNQFAYNNNTPVDEELYNLALDVLTRWDNEKNGVDNIGRVLPSDYLYFHGDGEHNYFRNAYSGNFNVWDYSLPNPYEN